MEQHISFGCLATCCALCTLLATIILSLPIWCCNQTHLPHITVVKVSLYNLQHVDKFNIVRTNARANKEPQERSLNCVHLTNQLSQWIILPRCSYSTVLNCFMQHLAYITVLSGLISAINFIDFLILRL